ncbi:ferritin [Thermobifida halotolerans]|uniref:Ferritin n=1 Tax=Thermobifida halotolerans TaxID=483545 RepID=A0A399G576_9ACTN|nr:ferritin [Thermobifida halotolerans]UOE20266.1 ferritin [Thermobifida halotolerans]
MTANVHSLEHGLSRFHQLLLDQLRHEFTASQQYVALAAWFDSRDLPQLAGFFYRQALEERDHAMMILRYLVDNDVPVTVPSTDAIQNDFDTPRDLVALALRQERAVTEQFHRLVKAAREENDYTGEQFLQWFLREQVEEVASMSTLLAVMDRANGNLFDVETFVARDMQASPKAEAGAPETAGPATI